MKIAIPLLSAVGYGGVTYVRGLLPALAKVDRTNEYHIYLKAGSPFRKLVDQGNFIFHEVRPFPDLGIGRFLWEQFVLPFALRRQGIEVLFTAKNIAVFLTGAKVITSLRNVEPLSYHLYENHWALDLGSRLRLWLTVLSSRKASGIVAVSQGARDRILGVLPQVAGKVVVIYNGNPVPDAPRPVRPTFGADYLINASKFVAYANQLNLVKAYALVRDRRGDVPELRLAGGVHDRNYHRQVRDFVAGHGLDGKVVFLGLLSHDDLLRQESGATGFLFPSTLEACPQALIEALSLGLPIATSNVPPMPEICGEGAIYFDPECIPDIAGKIEAILDDEGLRGRLSAAALARVACFDWERSAAELVNFWERTGTS